MREGIGTMARYYAEIQGNRGEATRMGTPSSGISAHPRGWDLGVRVSGYPSMGDTQRDEFSVDVTSGSNGHGCNIPAVTVRMTADGLRMVRHFTHPRARSSPSTSSVGMATSSVTMHA
jgi:hypothetical protein